MAATTTAGLSPKAAARVTYEVFGADETRKALIAVFGMTRKEADDIITAIEHDMSL